MPLGKGSFHKCSKPQFHALCITWQTALTWLIMVNIEKGPQKQLGIQCLHLGAFYKQSCKYRTLVLGLKPTSLDILSTIENALHQANKLGHTIYTTNALHLWYTNNLITFHCLIKKKNALAITNFTYVATTKPTSIYSLCTKISQQNIQYKYWREHL